MGGLWAAVGPRGTGTGSGMEERVGLSKAVGQAGTFSAAPLPASVSCNSWGTSCLTFRFLGRVL